MAKKQPKKIRPMQFETALKHLRAGKAIRRRGWHADVRLYRVGEEVFVQPPRNVSEAPTVWRPYSIDFLANDWEVSTSTLAWQRPANG